MICISCLKCLIFMLSQSIFHYQSVIYMEKVPVLKTKSVKTIANYREYTI